MASYTANGRRRGTINHKSKKPEQRPKSKQQNYRLSKPRRCSECGKWFIDLIGQAINARVVICPSCYRTQRHISIGNVKVTTYVR